MSILIPILLYHSISRDAAPRFRRWAIRPEDFATQIAYLHAQNYTAMTVRGFVTAMAQSGANLPPRPVVLTFDDGFADFYTSAMPVLKDHDFAATLYVATGFVGGTSQWLRREGDDERAMLTWAQIRDLQASGIEFGAHSHSHPQLDALPRSAAWDEILRSKTVLEDQIGRPVVTFAYPHGYYDAAVRRMVQQAGYTSACGVKHAVSALTDDRFALARIAVTADTDMERFAGLLVGRGLAIAPARERVRTKGWRLARRSAALLKRGLDALRRLPTGDAGRPGSRWHRR